MRWKGETAASREDVTFIARAYNFLYHNRQNLAQDRGIWSMVGYLAKASWDVRCDPAQDLVFSPEEIPGSNPLALHQASGQAANMGGTAGEKLVP